MLSPPHRQSNVAFPTEGPSEASPPPSPDRPVPESQSQTRVRQRSTFGGMRRQQPDRQAHLPPRGPSSTCPASSGEDEARAVGSPRHIVAGVWYARCRCPAIVLAARWDRDSPDSKVRVHVRSSYVCPPGGTSAAPIVYAYNSCQTRESLLLFAPW